MKILFYTPFNSRSRDTESLMQAFKNQGHDLFLLTQEPYGPYHECCEKLGVKVFEKVFPKRSTLIYYLQHSLYLIRFCRANKIDILYAHIESAGLPAVLSQYFIKTKVVTCRHIINEAYLMKSKKFILLNKIVYRLSRQIIVVSQHCKNWMILQEGIQSSKIIVIPLAYNFELYSKPDMAMVQAIKKEYPCRLLLLTACRLVKAKRADLSIRLAKQLILEGYDTKLLLLGAGPELDALKQEVKTQHLESSVFILGFKNNMMDYLAACDLLVHPSLLDSSSVIIKEAGLNAKPVLACSGIGDVDEYLQNNHNAFLISQENTEEEMDLKIRSLLQNPLLLQSAGNALRESVLRRFTISNLLFHYDSLHKTIPR